MKKIIVFIVFTSTFLLSKNIKSQQTYTLTAPDTIMLGEHYKCKIVFDSVAYKNCIINLTYWGNDLIKLSDYSFLFDYISVVQNNNYELNASIIGKHWTKEFVIPHRFYIIYPKKDFAKTNEESTHVKH